MCRLFALHGGREPVRASFWLLDAPDSLLAQSHRNPDGYGIGTFEPDGTPEVDLAALAAYVDERFAGEAREECSTTFLAHVRYASTGPVDERNSHPFAMDGRLFAHNGHFEGLAELEAELGPERARVRGDTDSERLFALISREAAANGGDVGAAVVAAVGWVAAHLPVYALNVIVTTPTDLWALRYPEPNELWLLEHGGGRELDGEPPSGRLRFHAHEAGPAVVVASERMDGDPHWRLLAPGELVHVGPDLRVDSRLAFPGPPARQLALSELGSAAASQASR